MKRSSRGFTLVEVAVAIAIIGSLAGLVSLSISSVFSSRARRCAEEIDAYISMCRINTISKANPDTIRLILDSDDKGRIRVRYYEDGEEKDAAVFSESNMTAEYTIGDITTQLSNYNPLTLSFDRSTGGFKPQAYIDGEPVYCTSIIITSGRSYVIVLTPSTGNHYVSRG